MHLLPEACVCVCLLPQDCKPVSTVIFRVQGPELADLLYAGTDLDLWGCKLLQMLMSFVQLQLQQVPPQSELLYCFDKAHKVSYGIHI